MVVVVHVAAAAAVAANVLSSMSAGAAAASFIIVGVGSALSSFVTSCWQHTFAAVVVDKASKTRSFSSVVVADEHTLATLKPRVVSKNRPKIKKTVSIRCTETPLLRGGGTGGGGVVPPGVEIKANQGKINCSMRYEIDWSR